MPDPATLEEYNRLQNENSYIDGLGAETTVHSACPWCCAPEFHVYQALEIEAASGEHTCKSCGRTMLYRVDIENLSLNFWHISGPDAPPYLRGILPARIKSVEDRDNISNN